MIAILLAMLAIIVLAGLVVVYVAFPHRGADMPRASWLGEAMRRGVDRLPTLDNRALRNRELGNRELGNRELGNREREDTAAEGGPLPRSATPTR